MGGSLSTKDLVVSLIKVSREPAPNVLRESSEFQKLLQNRAYGQLLFQTLCIRDRVRLQVG